MTSPSGWCLHGGEMPEEMRNSTRLSLSWNTSVMSMESPKQRWRSAAHFGQKRSKWSVVSSPLPQRGQIGDVIRPIRTWYEAVDVRLKWWLMHYINLSNYKNDSVSKQQHWPLDHSLISSQTSLGGGIPCMYLKASEEGIYSNEQLHKTLRPLLTTENLMKH